MRHHMVGQFIFALSALPLSVVSAQAQGLKTTSWDGAWLSGKDIKPAIEVSIKDGTFGQLLVDGTPREITSFEVSPDQKTLLFAWDKGQGTLLRLEDKAAEISLFGQKMTVRNMRVAKK